MKVILVNGSPHEHGCTYTALREAAAQLEAAGIGAEFFWLGDAQIRGCTGCGGCAKTGRCIYADRVNEFVALAPSADGFIFGSPVHFAGASGAMTSFMDRVFFILGGADALRLKPAAVVVSARRAGTTSAFDQLMKYPTYAQMLYVGSRYWPMVHGSTPDEVRQDAEGMQVMRVLGRNMAWLLKTLRAGEAAGISAPEQENKVRTNFIR